MIGALRRAGCVVDVGDDGTTDRRGGPARAAGRRRRAVPSSTPASRAPRPASWPRGARSTGARYRLDGAAAAARPADGSGPRRAAGARRHGHAARRLARPPAGGRSPGRSPGAAVALAADVSSQFVSGLLMVGPLLPGGLRIELTTAAVSEPYLDLTVAVMAEFGAHRAARPTPARSTCAPGRYVGRDVAIEPDASAASYFFAAAAICGGRVRVEGLGPQHGAGRPGVRRRARAHGLRGDDGLGRHRGAAAPACSTGWRSTWPTCPTRHRRWPPWPPSPTGRCGPPASASSGPRRPTASPPPWPSCAAWASTPQRRTTASSSARARPHGGVVHTVRRPPHGHGASPSSACGCRAWSIADPGCVAKTFPGLLGRPRPTCGDR